MAFFHVFPSVILNFCFILVAFNTVIWASLFSAYRLKLQKQPTRGVLRKSCSENMQQIFRRTSTPKCDFVEILLRHGYSPVNLLHIFRTFFLRNSSSGLLLKLEVEDFIFYVVVFSFPNFGMEILALCSAKFPAFIFSLILFSCST